MNTNELKNIIEKSWEEKPIDVKWLPELYGDSAIKKINETSKQIGIKQGNQAKLDFTTNLWNLWQDVWQGRTKDENKIFGNEHDPTLYNSVFYEIYDSFDKFTPSLIYHKIIVCARKENQKNNVDDIILQIKGNNPSFMKSYVHAIMPVVKCCGANDGIMRYELFTQSKK